MRNKLPILLALILMAAAAMPWLRSLESQRWSLRTRTTTVPPPEHATDLSLRPPGEGTDVSPRPSGEGPGVRAGLSGENDKTREARVDPKNSSTGGGTPKSADNSPSALPKPKELLDRAVRTLEAHDFISARVKEQGELFGDQITGEGRYYQRRQGLIPRIRFEMTAEIGSSSTSLVQVCNGVTFWTYRKTPSGETLSKIDAVRAISALDQAAGKLPREAMASSPGLGGLGRLMRGLNAQFEFTSVVADQLGGLPVWKLSGKWRSAPLALLLPSQKEAIEKGRPPDLTRLPAHVPDSVLLFLGQDDCFPFRIDYLRGVPRASPRRLLGLEFFELNFNGPIDSGQFIFVPASQEIIDRTEEFVRSLGG